MLLSSSPLSLSSLSVVIEMNSWASDLSCTDCNYCWCCLLLTQVNRMSHEEKKKKKRKKKHTAQKEGGTEVAGLGDCIWRMCG